jgi:S1-C subfamily serine protease
MGVLRKSFEDSNKRTERRMRFFWFAILCVISCLSVSEAMAQETNLLELSRSSGVKLISQSGNSSGSGFFIDDQHVLTCFHVVAALSVKDKTVTWTIYPDIQVVLPSGETIGGTVMLVPTQSDPAPLVHDFAIVKLNRKPSKQFSKVDLASDKETVKIGDDVAFSGYPLATPGMVTHRGMISGFNDSASLIFVQASINKGNSGGALLNSHGHAVGIISMREGGISQGLGELNVYIDQTASHGSVQIMGVDPLQATKAIIQTLDQYISTGIGYARSISFVREYISKNPQLMK